MLLHRSCRLVRAQALSDNSRVILLQLWMTLYRNAQLQEVVAMIPSARRLLSPTVDPVFHFEPPLVLLLYLISIHSSETTYTGSAHKYTQLVMLTRYSSFRDWGLVRQVTLTAKKLSLPQNDKKFDIVGLWKRVPFGFGFRFCLSNSTSHFSVFTFGTERCHWRGCSQTWIWAVSRFLLVILTEKSLDSSNFSSFFFIT